MLVWFTQPRTLYAVKNGLWFFTAVALYLHFCKRYPKTMFVLTACTLARILWNAYEMNVLPPQFEITQVEITTVRAEAAKEFRIGEEYVRNDTTLVLHTPDSIPLDTRDIPLLRATFKTTVPRNLWAKMLLCRITGEINSRPRVLFVSAVNVGVSPHYHSTMTIDDSSGQLPAARDWHPEYVTLIYMLTTPADVITAQDNVHCALFESLDQLRGRNPNLEFNEYGTYMGQRFSWGTLGHPVPGPAAPVNTQIPDHAAILLPMGKALRAEF